MGFNSLLLTGGTITVCYGPVKEDQMANATFKIEKGVLITKQGVGGGRQSKYPFAAMEIGDSVVGPKTIAPAARSWFNHHGRKCACRKQPDGFYRIWRTA
jgi:hypothetical protein